MKMKAKLLSVLFALLIVVNLTSHATAAGLDPAECSSSEKMVEKAQEFLHCGDKLPDWFTFHFYFELMEVDSDLAEQVLQHIDAIAKPIESLNTPTPPSSTPFNSGKSRRDGCYVRDGENGGHFVYDEFAEDEFMEDEPVMPEEENMIEPYSTTITSPKDGPRTSCICKLYIVKNGVDGIFNATGFFVSDRVVATAAHSLYNSSWGFLGPEGWASGVLISQAYDPASPPYGPYGVYEADPYNMAVGASWKTDSSPDNDWGVVVSNLNYRGNYSYLTKRQISDVTNYYNKDIYMYGYPSGNFSMECVRGTTVKPNVDLFRGYRTLYYKNPSGGDAEGVGGMSGSPIIDADGRVIGIFGGLTDVTSRDPRYGLAVTFDKYLYQKLKSYE